MVFLNRSEGYLLEIFEVYDAERIMVVEIDFEGSVFEDLDDFSRPRLAFGALCKD